MQLFSEWGLQGKGIEACSLLASLAPEARHSQLLSVQLTLYAICFSTSSMLTTAMPCVCVLPMVVQWWSGLQVVVVEDLLPCVGILGLVSILLLPMARHIILLLSC